MCTMCCCGGAAFSFFFLLIQERGDVAKYHRLYSQCLPPSGHRPASLHAGLGVMTGPAVFSSLASQCPGDGQVVQAGPVRNKLLPGKFLLPSKCGAVACRDRTSWSCHPGSGAGRARNHVAHSGDEVAILVLVDMEPQGPLARHQNHWQPLSEQVCVGCSHWSLQVSQPVPTQDHRSSCTGPGESEVEQGYGTSVMMNFSRRL